MLSLPSRHDIERMVVKLGEDRARALLREIWDEHEAEVLRRDPLSNPKWDGLRDGYVLPLWWDTVADLEHCRLLYAGGGRRASKSTDYAWLCMNSWLAYPGGLRWCLSDSEKTSQQTQQLQIWRYLPQVWKERYNMKESPLFKIKYQEGRGFTDNLLVLPTQPSTTVLFLTIGQKVKDYQGVSLGAALRTLRAWSDGKGKPFTKPDGTPYLIPNIGAWVDEDVTMEWLDTCMKRCEDQEAKVLWSFTPLKGVTQAVRETIGSAPRLIESRKAELLPQNRQMVKEIAGLPPGHMPYRVECTRPNTRAVFFFKDMNPFSGYELFKKESRRMAETMLMREGYGWCRDIRGRRFPKFGAAHLMRPEEFPIRCTNYRFVDPHPGRTWAIGWVRVWQTAGGRLKRLIYRDWPDAQTYGEWAVPTQRSDDGSKRGADGDPGPAQDARGYGIVDYKRFMLDREAVRWDMDGGDWVETDPYRRFLLTKALQDSGFKAGPNGRWTTTQVEDFRASHPEPVREVIFRSFFDPRAMANPMAAEKGGTTLGDLMLLEHRADHNGRLIAPSMEFEPAFSGKGIDDGVDHVNDMLTWDDQSPDGLIKDYNDPRLYVSTEALQVRWMFDHYTGLGGSEGACKEWADIARYASQTELDHVTEQTFRSHGGGSY